MYQVPKEWQELLQKDLELSNWGTEAMNAEEARYNAMTPAQKAAENNRRRANNEARRALGSVAAAPADAAPAAPNTRRSFPSPAANTRRSLPSGPKAPKGKVMRECTVSNVMHNVTMKNGSKAPCKFVHKNENAFSMLRPEQRKKAEGGKTRRSRKGRSSRRSSKSSRNRRSSKRRGGSVPNSPKPLSNVNTYTSWPGGVDPTVPLYNMKTML